MKYRIINEGTQYANFTYPPGTDHYAIIKDLFYPIDKVELMAEARGISLRMLGENHFRIEKKGIGGDHAVEQFLFDLKVHGWSKKTIPERLGVREFGLSYDAKGGEL